MLTLVRYFSSDLGTAGALLGPTGVICQTLELPWLDNAHCVSCIPVGDFSVSPEVFTGRFGSTFLVSVPQRSGILFHPGNTVADSKGCILPVLRIEGLVGFQSVAAMNRLRAVLKGKDGVRLRVLSL